MNKVILIGNVGKDAELKQFDNLQVAEFSIATNETYKNKQGEKVTNTEWHNIKAFGKLAEIAEKFFKKGTQLYVVGKLTTESWEKDGEKKYATKIILNEFGFIGGGKKEEQKQAPQPAPAIEDADDDLPF